MAQNVHKFLLVIGLAVTLLLVIYNVIDYGHSKNMGLPFSHIVSNNRVIEDLSMQMPLVNDLHKHHDDDTVAMKLMQQVRVLIWVMTSPKTLNTKARAVKETWAKHCDKIIFFSSENNTEFPTVGLSVPEGRDHLTAKTMKAFRYLYEHHINEADWFMKVDDDTYVIVENLRYFLSNKNTSEPVYFGHHLKNYMKQGYYSGGGGYVLSKEALIRLGKTGLDPSKPLCSLDFGAEDVEIGTCLEILGVRTSNSTDSMGRSRFHCFDPEMHVFGNYPSWYYEYGSNGARKGHENISDYAISFHYVSPEKMVMLEFYTYHLRPYGVVSEMQNLN